MSKRSPISLDVKLHVVERCLQHDSNPHHEAKQLGINKETVKDWIRKYEADGYEGLKESNIWKRYAQELKQAAIRDVLSGKYSIREVTKQYHISSKSVLMNWISKYTLANQLDYQKSMKKYEVSYQQVYAWVRKYQSGSEEALQDHRGRSKPTGRTG